MNRHLAGVVALAVTVWGGAISLGDYRDGRARLWISGGVIPIEARRETTPRWFWAFTSINAGMVLLIGVAGLLAAILP